MKKEKEVLFISPSLQDNKMKDFKKYYIINEEPEIVYKAFIVEKTLRLWTGAPAIMKEEIGFEFSLWDGNIEGVIKDFETSKMLQQIWFFGDQEEDSVVTFKFHQHKKGTSIELNHINIPDEAYDDVVEGWTAVFFSELIDFYLD